jgi:hypothetical protein
MPTTYASGHGIKFVHVATTGQFAPIIGKLNQAVVADTIILQRFVACPAVLLSEERPKEDAINLVQALVREPLAGGCRRRGLFDLNDHGGKGQPFGRSARINPVVRRRRNINTGTRTNGQGYPPSPPPLPFERFFFWRVGACKALTATAYIRHTDFNFCL